MKNFFLLAIMAVSIGIAFSFAPPEPETTTLRIIGGGSEDFPLIKIEFYDLQVSSTVPRQTVSGGAEYFSLSQMYSLTQALWGHYRMKVYYRENSQQSWMGGASVISSSSNTSGQNGNLILFWADAEEIFDPPE